MIIDSIHHQQSEQLTRNSALEKNAKAQAPVKESAGGDTNTTNSRAGNGISVYSRHETLQIEHGARGQFIDTRI